MTPAAVKQSGMLGERFIQTRDIPARSGGWVAINQGRVIRIVGVEGTQVADMFTVR